MNVYIATFYTHFAAMKSQQRLIAADVDARLSPVPRSLSASCGTCVRYMSDEAHEACMHTDLERIVLEENGAYREIIARS